jgi:type II secretory pathway component PulF
MSKTTVYQHLPPSEEAESRSWGMGFVGLFTWFIPAVVFVALMAGCSGLVITPLAPIGAPLLAFFVAFAINRYQQKLRRQRAMIILSYIENAVRLNLPIDAFLYAAELAERGATRIQLRALRLKLGQGYPVGTALSACVPEFPGDYAAELTAAEQVGQLRSTLSRITETNLRPTPTMQDDLSPIYRIYPFGILLGGSMICLFMMIFVVPKFKEIFKDFRTDLPLITETVFNLGNFISDSFIGAIAMLLLAVIVMLAIAYQLQHIFTPTWAFPRPRMFMDWLTWHTPVWRRIERDRGLAAACVVLAEATRTGLPLDRAMDHVLSLPVNQHLKPRLYRWRMQLAAGKTPEESARDARLPAIIASFLASSSTPRASSSQAALSDVFAFLGRYYRDRFSHTTLLLRAAFEPAIVVVMGFFVGIFVYAMFAPLVKLLNSVMGIDGGTL